MSNDIKVTDKRMFTVDGELREEYRHLESASPAAAVPPEEAPAPPAGQWAAGPAAAAPAAAPPATEPAAPPFADEPLGQRGGPTLELPGTPPELAPSFVDLLGVLAQPVPLYLGDATLPDGTSMENLDEARFYIDLLDVLRQKTAGNLTAQEAAVLEDLLYRLRLRYVQKRG